MVNAQSDTALSADVIFVVECTAVSGAYFNDLKEHYLMPTIQYFSQGYLEDSVLQYNSTLDITSTMYGMVTYFTADRGLRGLSDSYGPYSNPRKLKLAVEHLELKGGRGESQAHISEALSTALECFQDLDEMRDGNSAAQKHCILFCTSPPYLIGVQESTFFPGYTVDDLAPLFQERNINLSIVSPRKCPAFFKIFEQAGGDLQSSLAKNYAKDLRHLVLLKNYSLQERPVSPVSGAGHGTTASTAQIPLSPLQSNDSPNTGPTAQGIAPSVQAQGSTFRNQTPQNITSVHQPVAPSMNIGRPGFNPQINAPPNYHPSGMAARSTHQWRMRPPGPPFIAPTGAPPTSTPGSALLAQLNQPPSSLGLNMSPFGQRMDGNPNNTMGGNPQQQQTQQQQQQQQQQQLTQQQQIRLMMQNQQQNQQQTSMGMQAQQVQNQPGSQLSVSGVNQPTSTQGPLINAAPQTATAVTSGTPQVSHPQAQANIGGGQQMIMGTERHIIWQGTLEWIEKNKNMNDTQKQTKQVPCQVSIQPKEGEMDLKTDAWPQKLLMQLMPKMLLGTIGNAYLKNSRSVCFYPTPCEALESLVKVMSSGFAGCVHFNSAPPCGIKVLLLLYTAEKRSFLGFIPNDQSGFVDRLRKVIQQQKNTQALRHQTQAGTANAAGMQGGMPTTGISQGNILMSQTNTMAMGGGQITQNVVPSNQQQNLAASGVSQTQMNLQGANMTNAQQVGATGGGMMSQQRPQFDELGMARQQNLLKIQQLRQTLEAAQQQEAKYKSQLEIQQNLEVAQQQEMQYKQQLEQAQRGLNQPGMAGQQGNPQRMMRPVMNNNLGLRHLLQQQQPQYRQVVGMQQQMVGPRGQMNTRTMEPGNPQNQQYDVVSDYDFLG